MTKRVQCCVLGCKRTIGVEILARRWPPGEAAKVSGWEWICAKHWTCIPKVRRRVYTRAWRRFFKSPSEASYRPVRRLWCRLVRDAYEWSP